MSTRGAILIQDSDGDKVLIYHHHDTYPSGLGRYLDWYVRERLTVLNKEHGDFKDAEHYYPPPNIMCEAGKFAAVLLGDM
ncbi:MAG: hypothetical protein WC322_06600 [Candidatus Paceibacterota bacterium]|jgi:hypothetical protein